MYFACEPSPGVDNERNNGQRVCLPKDHSDIVCPEEGSHQIPHDFHDFTWPLRPHILCTLGQHHMTGTSWCCCWWMTCSGLSGPAAVQPVLPKVHHVRCPRTSQNLDTFRILMLGSDSPPYLLGSLEQLLEQPLEDPPFRTRPWLPSGGVLPVLSCDHRVSWIW